MDADERLSLIKVVLNDYVLLSDYLIGRLFHPLPWEYRLTILGMPLTGCHRFGPAGQFPYHSGAIVPGAVEPTGEDSKWRHLPYDYRIHSISCIL